MTDDEVMRKVVFDTVADIVNDFLDHDRREDEELPPGTIDAMVGLGAISEKEIVDKFSTELHGRLMRTVGT